MEITYDEEIHKRINHLLRERTCIADGMFRRCDQNRVNMFGKQQVSSQTVGESKKRATLNSMPRKFRRETG